MKHTVVMLVEIYELFQHTFMILYSWQL